MSGTLRIGKGVLLGCNTPQRQGISIQCMDNDIGVAVAFLLLDAERKPYLEIPGRGKFYLTDIQQELFSNVQGRNLIEDLNKWNLQKPAYRIEKKKKGVDRSIPNRKQKFVNHYS